MSAHPEERKLHAIIPAGGAGTRLWPLSTSTRPKFLLDLLGTGRSLLQETVLRLAPISASVTVVTGAAHAAGVRQQMGQVLSTDPEAAHLEVTVVEEPEGRDSMPAIGLATAMVRSRVGEDAVVGSFAADHAIRNSGAFLEVVSRAIGGAVAGYVTTVGIQPDAPSTAYGYIEPAQLEVAPEVQLVRRFVEKPPAETARRYVAEGYLWNAGMFVATTGVLWGHLARLHPQMAASLWELGSSWDDFTPREQATAWDKLPRVAIDHAIAEPLAAEGGMAVVSSSREVGWSDVGDFDALARLTAAPDSATVVKIGSADTYVSVPDRKLVALVGMPNAAVVDTGEAILVVNRDCAQDVKAAVDAFRLSGFAQFL